MNRARLVAIAILALPLLSHGDIDCYNINVPPSNAADAINILAKQTGAKLLFPYDLAQTRKANPVSGCYALQEALELLLEGSGLQSGLSDRGIMKISLAGSEASEHNSNDDGEVEMKTKKGILAAIAGILFGAGGSQGVVAQEGAEKDTASNQYILEEIVVTASRREASLQDTAISIAAIGGEEINRRNLSEMNDYLRTVPGVNYIELGLGNNAAVVRGLGVDPEIEGFVSSPTTGIYFGEVSLAGLGSVGGSADIRMVDLDRVEVLRGPQGTLFGSSALGGAIRNIPAAPDLQEVGGNVKGTYSETAKTGGRNTKFEGVINIPVIEDTLAIRAVVYDHKISGYVKNIAGTVLTTGGEISPGVSAADAVAIFGGSSLYQNESNVGRTSYTGGRISALWKPTDRLSVTLLHAYQDAKQEGQSYVELGLPDYAQVSLQYGGGEITGEQSGYEDEINITSLVAEYDLEWASLLSSSAWVDEDGARNQDQSAFGGAPAPQIGESAADVFSQEFRVVSQGDSAYQYVLGVYYEDIKSNATFDIWLSQGSSPATSTVILDMAETNNSIEQLAFYGELSYDINEQFEVTLGARRFDYERTNREVGDGLFGSNRLSNVTFGEKGTNLKVNLSYMPNDDTHIYAQWAEGFRLGNVNPQIDLTACDANNDGILDGTDAPLRKGFDSDNSENIELGAKLSLIDSRLEINAAVYRVNWDGIPVLVFGGALPGQAQTCLQSTTINAGEARSQGFEVEAIYHFSHNFQMSFGSAYTDAKLTRDAPELSAVSGDRLPSSPEYNVNIGFLYEFEFNGRTPFIQGNYAYVSEFYNRLGENGIEAGGYGQLNVSSGIMLDQFSIELFAQNVTNDSSLVHGSTAVPDNRAFQLRPRTVGLNVGFQF